jgi:hypothetical protein
LFIVAGEQNEFALKTFGEEQYHYKGGDDDTEPERLQGSRFIHF